MEGIISRIEEIEGRTRTEIESCARQEGRSAADIKAVESEVFKLFALLRSLHRDLETAIEESDGDEENIQNQIRIFSDHKAIYQSLQLGFKEAVRKRHQALHDIAHKRRMELLGTSHDAASRRQQLSSEADVLSASQGITDSLRRTKNMMATELEHSGAQLAAMETSHERLRTTGNEYQSQNSLLGRSKSLLRVINWQNKSEMYLLWAGLVLFCLVVLYISHKRSIYFVPKSLRPVSLVRSALSIVQSHGTTNDTELIVTDKEDSALIGDQDSIAHTEL